MKKYILLLALPICFVLKGLAQQIPLGSCGIVYIYDATGNRTKRLYYCNNGGPYPTSPNKNPSKGNIEETYLITRDESKQMEFQPVSALYPNPTSGIFYITFSKMLSNATVSIIDDNGKKVQVFKSSGTTLTCNISSLSAGTYFLRIEEGKNVITKRVIKQ